MKTATSHTLLYAIGLITCLTGILQCAFPGVFLRLLATAPAQVMAAHVFGIVGMFMLLFGGMLVHALVRRELSDTVLLWSALQKLGASVAVSVGVMRGIFLPIALLVVSFDFASGVLMMTLVKRSHDGARSLLNVRSSHG